MPLRPFEREAPSDEDKSRRPNRRYTHGARKMRTERERQRESLVGTILTHRDSRLINCDTLQSSAENEIARIAFRPLPQISRCIQETFLQTRKSHRMRVTVPGRGSVPVNGLRGWATGQRRGSASPELSLSVSISLFLIVVL